jgi:hypothetical protein
MPTKATKRVLSILRDGSQFQWYVIPLFAFTVDLMALFRPKRLPFCGSRPASDQAQH